MRLATCALLTTFLFGCGGGGPNDAPKLAPAGGVVMFNGKPLPDATVTFYPESGPAGIGMGNENGEFRVKTNGSDGAPLGTCKVTVTVAKAAGGAIPPADGNVMELAKDPVLPAKYGNKDTTDIQVSVDPAGNLDLKLELTP